MIDSTDLRSLELSWRTKSHFDDWNVPVVYPAGFKELLVRELEHLADNDMTPAQIMERAQAIRSTGPEWGYYRKD